MPKTIVETKVASVKAFDSKFESGAKKAAKEAADAAVKSNGKFAPGALKDDGYCIALKVNVELDADERKVRASCKWEIEKAEKGTRKLFPNLKQSKAASAAADVNPEKVSQGNVDDAVYAAAETEVAGILKKLP